MTESAGAGFVAACCRRSAAAQPPTSLPDAGSVLRRVRLRAGYGDDDDVAAGGQVDVGPTKRRHLAAAQGAMEDQRDDRSVD